MSVRPLTCKFFLRMAALLLLSACAESGPEQLAAGAQIYAAQCASCHGAKLEGQPDWAQEAAERQNAGAAAR